MAIASAIALAPVAAPLAGKIDPAHLALKDCPDRKGCPALVLLDETTLNNEPVRARLSYHRQIKIFTEAGADQYGTFEIFEEIGSDAIRDVKGRTILPDGSSVGLNHSQITIKTAYKSGKTRIRIWKGRFPSVAPGAIVEYSYDNVTATPGYYTGFLWSVQQDIPVLSTTFTLKHGKTQFHWAETGADPTPIRHTSEFENADEFFAGNVPALPLEPLGPPAHTWTKRVHFHPEGLQNSWLPTVAVIIGGGAGRMMATSVASSTKAKELTTGAETPQEKAQRIYAFVQGTISEPSSMGDHMLASDVDEVLQRGYGTDYERTILFISLLQHAGLKAELLAVVGRDWATLDPFLPDPDQFDSWATSVLIGAVWRYADPATRNLPFGELAPGKENVVANALPIKAVAGGVSRDVQGIVALLGPIVFGSESSFDPNSLVTIPVTPAARNLTMREAVVRIEASGAARLEVTEGSLGQAALEARRLHADATPQERSDRLEHEVGRRFPGARLLEARFEGFDNPAQKATIIYAADLPSFATSAPGRLLIVPSVFPGQAHPFATTERRTPVTLPRTVKTVDRIRFALPEGYEIRERPEPVRLQDGPLLFETWFDDDEQGGVVFTRRLEIGQIVWPPADYGRLRAFHEAVVAADRLSLSLWLSANP